MDSGYPPIWPWVFALLVPLLLYWRFRRSFGPQRLRPARMILRMLILIILAVSLAPLAHLSQRFLLAEIGGAVFGLSLAAWGAHVTRFARRDGQLYYIPHTYAGVAISLLVVARLVYRFAGAPPASGTDSAQASIPATAVQNPLTVALLFALIAYYLGYYARVLWKSKHLDVGDLESGSGAVSP